MKTAILPALFTALSLAARAAIVVPGADGSDGVLNITVNTEIDLSQAPTGTWDQNNAANAGKGVYDPAKWAVVFKYSSVNVAAGATVTFKNHASRAPVVWLVNGNVTIAGTVTLDGKNGWLNGITSPELTEPGPGGFRGGAMYYAPGIHGGKGFGPGGGPVSGGASHSTSISNSSYQSGGSYGNPSLVPLMGGSGGGGQWDVNVAGGGGGGALLIACANDLDCSGKIQANGGWSAHYGGGGSGGGVRIVTNSFLGGGVIEALAGAGTNRPGGVGRIRIERVSASGSHQVSPDPSVVPLAAGAIALLWPPSEAPNVKIVSIGGIAAPSDPRASFGSAGADASLPILSSTDVIIETTNVEQAAVVKVRVTPRSQKDFLQTSGNIESVSANLDTIISTNPLVIRWVATLPVNTGYSAVQAHVIRP